MKQQREGPIVTESTLVNAAGAERYLGVPAHRVRAWARTGRLLRIGGVAPVYRAGDILDLNAQTEDRAARGDRRCRRKSCIT